MTAPTLSVMVPASTSNLGAGFDCLGLALDLWLEARLVPGGGDPVYGGTLEGMTPERDIVCRLLADAPGFRDFRLELDSQIPVGNGLGSSAAATVAGLTLVYLLRGDPPDKDAIYEDAVSREGHPDNAGPATYGGLLLAVRSQRGRTSSRSLAVDPRIGFAFAVPSGGIETAEARRMLPDTVARSVAVGQASRSAALIAGLLLGDGGLIQLGMEDLIAVPTRASTISGFEAAVRAGTAAGAFGVTISGAGASLVGITPVDRALDVAEAMAQALVRSGNPARAVAPRPIGVGVSWERRK